ncbi:MAG TPA: AAA family ATPase [Gemmataceae bacterium]|nr:AAA family ATPase [Gemmataceae bacterium]
MDLPELLTALSDPAAYPRPAQVDVRQTHLSAVFLVGDTVYKVRKPVNLGFVDFTTLEKRKRDCDEEVRLNRRLAPSVYRGAVPITRGGGRVKVGGSGEPIEWAVEMVRLPDEATLKERLARDEVTVPQIENIARRIAEFHRAAQRGEHVSRYGRFDVVAGNARENFIQTAGHVGLTVRRPVYDRCRELTERVLTDLKDVIEARAARGVPCDTHGDLHLSHVYLFPDRPPPDDLVIIDCIEFAERFRFADPVADIAFLVMDLAYHGRPELAPICVDTYFAASGDDEGRRLLPFYVAYRAVVRAKVKGMAAQESEVAEEQRTRMRAEAQAHWLFAFGTLEEPARRPVLALVGGLPGTGKSTLARGLAAAANLTVIRSDEVRKELAGVPRDERAAGFYTPEWTERVYSECLKRAGDVLRDGGRAIVDASFATNRHRRMFLTMTRQLGVPAVLLVCRAPEGLVRERLRLRRGDVSDAGWEVFEGMRDRWDELSAETRRRTVEVDTTDAAKAVQRAVDVLRGPELV